MPPRQQTVSLVLGSGGARGLTHIGVIRWLDEQGYRITSIAGCSIGALIGGLYAAGKLAAFEQWLLGISRRDMLTLIDLSFQRTGLISGDKLIGLLRDQFDDTAIETLPIRFTAVAANIENGREVWLNRGPLFDAIRASISIPVLFQPYRLNGALLVDGGIINPVPIAPTLGDDTDLTIAVNVSGQVQRVLPQPPARTRSKAGGSPMHRFIENLKQRATEAAPVNWGMLDVANQAFDTMQSTIARQKMAAYPPDVTVEIPRNLCRVHEFDRAAELIDFGYQLAGESVPEAIARNAPRRAGLGGKRPEEPAPPET
jgi:NTE family protein